jgi:putative heme-binding domain-containing protein
MLNNSDRTTDLLGEIERQNIPANLLSAVHRTSLLNAKQPEVRRRAAEVLRSTSSVNDETFIQYSDALTMPRDSNGGQQEKCANCHRAHGIGYAVGPDLNSEFQRAEETILRDVLAPSDSITAGFGVYLVVTNDGQTFNGLLGSESPTSLTLRMPQGKERVILRKEIDQIKALPVSMMPDDLYQTVGPKELADLLAWLRRPANPMVLLDDNPSLLDALNEGTGNAEFVSTDQHSGTLSLCVTPPQRYSARIPGWDFKIREKPMAGEYRYLRLAWKTADGDGVMLELAADGVWPPAASANRRYHAGSNDTGWRSTAIGPAPPRQWTEVEIDLWKENGDFTLTGFAPTAIGGAAFFDAIELHRTDSATD